MVRVLAVLLFGLALIAPAPVAADPAGVVATWQRAHVAIPAALLGDRPIIGLWRDPEVHRALASVVPERQVPAVMFLHGCDGIGHEEESWKLLLMDLGYAAFFPDSLARPGRQANCDQASHATALFPAAHDQGQEEITYALSDLRRLPWVDRARVVLVGYSEGSMAAARYAGGGVAGVVILGWHCHGAPPYDGLRIPADVQVLAILGENDPWYEARHGLHCGLLFGGRVRATSLVLPGNGHGVLTAPSVANAELAKRAVTAFLGDGATP